MTITNGPVDDGFNGELVTLAMTLKNFKIDISKITLTLNGASLTGEYEGLVIDFLKPLELATKGLINRKKINSKGNDESVYLKHVQNVIKNRKNRAQLLLEQYDKTQNLDFFNHEKENFSYSGF